MTPLEEACDEYRSRVRASPRTNSTMLLCQVAKAFRARGVTYDELSDATLDQMFTKSS